MEIPDTLPARLYLLAYDPVKQRLASPGPLGYLLRAAALVDLQLRGHLADRDGTPQVNARMAQPADPVLAGVLRDVAESRPRPWRHWVRKHARATTAAVADQLAAGGWIELQPRRVVPFDKVTLHRPEAVTELGNLIRAALRESTPVAEVDPRAAALVALAAAGDLGTALPVKQHERRIAALTEVAGEAAPALRTVIRLFAPVIDAG